MTTSGDAALTDSFRHLVDNPPLLTPLRLWRALGHDEREDVAMAFMAESPVNRGNLARLVAGARNFRLATVERWPDAKIADAMKHVPVSIAKYAESLLEVVPRAPARRPLAHRFAGLLGLPDPAAVLGPDAAGVSEDAVRQAADALLDEFGARETFVYFLAVVLLRVPFAEPLQRWMQEQTSAEPAPEQAPDVAPEPAEEPPADHVRADEVDETGRERTFTTLDRVLIQAAVDAKHGNEGALSEDEVDDMVDDYVHLSGRRPRSHFHAGFRDALFVRPSADALPATSRSHERWYWAGAVQGWARMELWQRIVGAYDEHELVRSLGDGHPASIAAVGDLVRAFREEDRLDDLAEFVQTRAITAFSSPDLFRSLSNAATDLLRRGEAARALPIFELLERASRSAKRGGPFSDDQLILAAKRRRAHCLRQLNQHDTARRILTNLLKRGPAPPIRAMLHADLGLMNGGFSGLDDVRLPQRPESLGRAKAQLEAGRDHFARAVDANVRYASHGHFCLGVLALCNRDWAVATTHLEQAHAVIGTGSGHYDEQLVARVVLYLGIARVVGLADEDLSRGAKLMADGLNAGSSLPPYLVKEVMEALDLGPKDGLRNVALLVKQNGDEPAFDALATSPAVEHCTWLAPALYERAQRPMRKKAEAVADLHAALRGYRGAAADPDASEHAFRVLDMLEGYAMQGIGADRFMEMLSRDDYDCPPLQIEDARVAHARCLEAQGKNYDAAAVLDPIFHQLATDRRVFDAGGVLQKIKDLGVPADHYEHMERRLAELIVPSDDAEGEESPDDARAVSVLVVGGDERQAKWQDRVQAAVKRADALVTVHFVRSGWSANWQQQIEQVQGLLQKCDAAVVMRFMRTHFGRKVREECGAADVPWRFCWGGGVTAQVRAVEEAARAGRSAASDADQR